MCYGHRRSVSPDLFTRSGARLTANENALAVEELRGRLAETEALLARARAREAEFSLRLEEMKRFVSVMEILENYLKRRFREQQEDLVLLFSSLPPKFRHIMGELQGAIIVGSIFQSTLGFTGLISLFLRMINLIVVAPTVAAIGLAFFSYGFPLAGSCVEVSIPQMLLVLINTLYLRGISVFGLHLFQIYAVPLSVMIKWTCAFFLTTGGAYDYEGCSPDIPSSNILLDACIKHTYTMKHFRTDVSNALRTAAWVRIPYPLQWGIPIYHLRTSLIMNIVSLVASVDSVGTYHTASLVVNSNLQHAELSAEEMHWRVYAVYWLDFEVLVLVLQP